MNWLHHSVPKVRENVFLWYFEDFLKSLFSQDSIERLHLMKIKHYLLTIKVNRVACNKD